MYDLLLCPKPVFRDKLSFGLPGIDAYPVGGGWELLNSEGEVFFLHLTFPLENLVSARIYDLDLEVCPARRDWYVENQQSRTSTRYFGLRFGPAQGL